MSSVSTPYTLDFSLSQFGRLINMNKNNYASLSSGIYINRIVSGIINFNYPSFLNLNISNIT